MRVRPSRRRERHPVARMRTRNSADCPPSGLGRHCRVLRRRKVRMRGQTRPRREGLPPRGPWRAPNAAIPPSPVGIDPLRPFTPTGSIAHSSIGKPSLFGAVEKPGPGSERVPLVMHGRGIDLTLSSRRRSNATEKGAFVSKGAPLRRAPDAPRLSLDTARERAYSG